jgi:hypothetical protein
MALSIRIFRSRKDLVDYTYELLSKKHPRNPKAKAINTVVAIALENTRKKIMAFVPF